MAGHERDILVFMSHLQTVDRPLHRSKPLDTKKPPSNADLMYEPSSKSAREPITNSVTQNSILTKIFSAHDDICLFGIVRARSDDEDQCTKLGLVHRIP
jgi:hypothetical protein